MAEDFVIEMLHITKEFPGIKANDDITLQLRKGEVHALLGENGAGKSTLMSVLFGLYQPEAGKILKNGKEVAVRNPNDANALGIGMVHQHFKLVECFSVLDNIILGVEPNKLGFLQKAEARKKVMALSEKYGLRVDPDALISDISVGMQQRVEILKMLYRDNEILIFDEPTAVLTPQEIDELMEIMRGFKKEGKSILFITHKLNEIMAVADRCTVLRKGKYMGTVDIKDTTKEELSRMMVGRDVQLQVDKKPAAPGEVVLDVQNVTMHNAQHKKDAVKNVSFQVRGGEIVCFFPVAVGLLDGLRAADADQISLLRAMGANRAQIFWHIKLPGAMPSFFSGLKISVSFSIVGAVIAEWLGGSSGLGVYMTRARKSFAYSDMFAVIFLVVAISLLLIGLTNLLEKKTTPWRQIKKT